MASTFRCEATTAGGSPCRNRVPRPGSRCHAHLAVSAAPPELDYASLLAQPQELDPELADHLVDGPLGKMIRHPLVISLVHVPALNAAMNMQLRQKAAAVREAVREGDWGRYIWLYERPYRVDAFMDIMDKLSDRQYWKLLRQVWIDTENSHEWGSHTIRQLMCESRPDPHQMMTEQEREWLQQLPDPITVYRGNQHPEQVGWSWTLDPQRAEWFARRFDSSSAWVAEARISKADVLGYFISRGESEILIDPDKVMAIAVSALTD